METLQDLWPLFGLSLATPRLELRPVRDEDLPALITAVRNGVHDPAVMPFSVPWTDATGDELVRNTLQHQWRNRTALSADHWIIDFGIWLGVEFIGVQDLSADRFPTRRTVQSGSWLTRSAHGHGFGTEMRQAIACYAFDYLGAEVAESEAAEYNAASLAVSRKVGYQANGQSRAEFRRGQGATMNHLRLTPDLFHRPGWTLGVKGHNAVARFLEL